MAKIIAGLHSKDPTASNKLIKLFSIFFNKDTLNIDPNSDEQKPHVKLVEALRECVEAFDPEKANLEALTPLAHGPTKKSTTSIPKQIQ